MKGPGVFKHPTLPPQFFEIEQYWHRLTRIRYYSDVGMEKSKIVNIRVNGINKKKKTNKKTCINITYIYV